MVYQLYEILNIGFFVYSVAITSVYCCFVYWASLAIKKNKKRATFLQVDDIVGADDVPSVTLIAPAYNEGMTILTNVKSLLSSKYPYYNLIIVNDGSSDDSMQQLIAAYELEKINASFITEPILTARVRGVYKSKNKLYQSLTVIDKKNGGRADALNAGINFAETELVLLTDADCIIEQDAILKMIRPYLQESDKEIVAIGGGIGIVNDSEIHNGLLKKLSLPRKLLPRFQVVEYIRAFLLGRMAWSEINGLMLVSGAFGMFPRMRVIEVGGLNPKTVGEDFELCVRLRKHMEDLKEDYRMVYIPETLCWTECPDTYKVFIKQRDRWARGLWETLAANKKLFFNRKYRGMGFFFFPYWVFFEFLAPVVEVSGVFFILYLGATGMVSWPLALKLFLLVYITGCLFSTVAIFIYVKNFKHYDRVRTFFRLLIAAYLEPFLFHPVLLYAQIKGYYKKMFNIESGWGTMTRRGFNTKKKRITPPAVASPPADDGHPSFGRRGDL